MKIYACSILIAGLTVCNIAIAGEGSISLKAQSVANSLCTTCHGTNGHSVMEGYPSLAGQKAAYLEKQMIAFKEGTRKDPIMMNMVVSFDQDMIKEIARHYESQGSEQSKKD
ncbi:MAG: c-type cytochrome [Proteobacteria bacterium]|nr:c-type cytochrome [Pseudomonadota bacterium]